MSDKQQPEPEKGINIAAEISEIAQSDTVEATPRVLMESEKMLTIDGHPFELVLNYRDGFDPDKLGQRFSDILLKYNYIVGDWGYEQLRLKGFYSDNNKHARRDQMISCLEDYLNEYCNFGCAYFVLSQVGAPTIPKSLRETAPRRRRNRKPRRRKPAESEKRVSKQPLRREGQKVVTAQKGSRHRHFTVKNKPAKN